MTGNDQALSERCHGGIDPVLGLVLACRVEGKFLLATHRDDVEVAVGDSVAGNNHAGTGHIEHGFLDLADPARNREEVICGAIVEVGELVDLGPGDDEDVPISMGFDRRNCDAHLVGPHETTRNLASKNLGVDTHISHSRIVALVTWADEWIGVGPRLKL